MRVSCIIPVYNCDNYVGEAIESVLMQTLPVDEILVVNDGSTDDTVRVLNEFGDKIQVINKVHSGLPETLNMGIENASCDILSFLDSDDLWVPEKNSLQVEFLGGHSETDIVFSMIDEFVSPELDAEESAGLVAREPMQGFAKACMLARKEVFDRVGDFGKMQFGDFIEWFTRAKNAGIKYAVIDEILVHRRVHLNNYTRKNKHELSNFALIMKQHLDRKRASLKKN